MYLFTPVSLSVALTSTVIVFDVACILFILVVGPVVSFVLFIYNDILVPNTGPWSVGITSFLVEAFPVTD